jgi:hypothetical protein
VDDLLDAGPDAAERGIEVKGFADRALGGLADTAEVVGPGTAEALGRTL